MYRPDSRRQARAFFAAAITAFCLAALLTPATADATASLRLYPDVSDGGGGQLVTHTPFTLNIVNDGHGNGDNTAYGVLLVVAVADPALLDTVHIFDGDLIDETVTEADLSIGTPVFLCDGRPMPPHGVYPASYTTIELGDIEAGQTVALMVDYAGSEGLSVHFDAFGTGIKNNGGCRDIYNPFGHDVTALVPDGQEPPPPECELEIDKTSDVDAVIIGDEATYTITVSNLSDCDLTAVSVTDYIPFVSDGTDDFPAFTVLATNPLATVTATEVIWDFETMAAGDTSIMTMTVAFDQELADGHVVVNAACVESDQTEEECDAVGIAVGEVDEIEPFGGPGFWCRQVRAAMDGHHNAQFTIEELETWLGQINEESIVFPEMRDTETLDVVRLLLCRPNTLDTAADRLMRHLMTLWFNIVSERLDPELTLGELCAGDEPLPEDADPGWSVGYVLEQTELVLDTGADDPTLNFWKDVIDFINNSSTPENCQTIRSMRGFRRLQP